MEKNNCNKCKKKILAGVRFCPFCGSEQKVNKTSTAYDKNPYDILQVTSNAEEEVIKAAYQSLAKKYHPDMIKNGTSEERMKELNWAYGELNDPHDRNKWTSEDQTKPPKRDETEGASTKKEKPPSKPKQTATTTSSTTPINRTKEKNKGIGIYIGIAFVIGTILCLGIFGIGGALSIIRGIDSNTRIYPTATKKISAKTPIKQTPVTIPEYNTVFYDQFTSNVNGWDTTRKEHEFGFDQSIITKDRLIWSGEANSDLQGFQTGRWPNIDQYSNFSVSVDVFKKTGKTNTSNHGIAFRANEFGGYSFLIRDQYFAVFAVYINGEDVTLIDWTYDSNINLSKENKMSVFAIDDNLEFLINNKSVAQIVDNRFLTGYIGLEFGIYEPGTKATVEFDNLSIRLPVESTIGNPDSSSTKEVGSIDLCKSGVQNNYCVYVIGFLEDTPRITIKYTKSASSNVNLQVNGEVYVCSTSNEFTGNLICWGKVFPNPNNASVSIISKDNNEVIAEGVVDLPSW